MIDFTCSVILAGAPFFGVYMAKLKPFKAWRPRTWMSAPRSQAHRTMFCRVPKRAKWRQRIRFHFFMSSSRKSISHLALTFTRPRLYQTGAAKSQADNRLVNDGALIREEVPALYLYRQRMGCPRSRRVSWLGPAWMSMRPTTDQEARAHAAPLKKTTAPATSMITS